MREPTRQRITTPTAILVAIEDPLAAAVLGGLTEVGLKVLRVGHVAAACERIPVTMPQLVIVTRELSDEDRALLQDRSVAVGAELLTLAPAAAGTSLLDVVRDAAKTARARAFRNDRGV